MDGGTTLKSVEFSTMFVTKILKEISIKILDQTDVSVLTNDIEVCHCMGSSLDHSKRRIVSFRNRKLRDESSSQ